MGGVEHSGGRTDATKPKADLKMRTSDNHTLTPAVATGTYADVVGYERATAYFDSVEIGERSNLEFAYETALPALGGFSLSAAARDEYPFLD